MMATEKINNTMEGNMKKDTIAELYFPLAFIVGQLAIAVIAVAAISA